MPPIDLLRLKHWFIEKKRDLPWRNNPTPYQVWVSEIMLQQTQVAVVIPYFIRWMTRFPTIQTLAEASLDEVIKLWEGLGYYSRARNLHEGAKQVVQRFGGQIPCTAAELAEIKGLGPYTIGALLSFAFHQKIAAVDGNVLRVLARHFVVEGDVTKLKIVQQIRSLADSLLPDEEHWIVNEALIELGATICGKTPKCGICPLRTTCLAYAKGNAHLLPFKAARKPTIFLRRLVAVIIQNDHVLLRKGQPGEIMQSLHEFPYFEIDQEPTQEFLRIVEQEWGTKGKLWSPLPMEKHAFTSYRVCLYPYVVAVEQEFEKTGYEWTSFKALEKLAFSAGHRRVLKNLWIYLSKQAS